MQAQSTLPRTDDLVVSQVRVRGSFENPPFVGEHDRSEIGDAGRHVQQLPLHGRVEADVPLHLGSGSDHAHVAPQHVPQLRAFIQLEAPQHAPHARDAGIALRRRVDPRAIRPYHHRAQLHHAERAAPPPDPCRHVERTVTVLQPDRGAGDEEEG